MAAKKAPKKTAAKKAAPKKAAAGTSGSVSAKTNKPSIKKPKIRPPQAIVVDKFAPTFPVADVEKALKWYKEVLGFNVAFRQADPTGAIVYGGVTRGAARLHLAQMFPDGPLKKSAAYLFMKSGVDELAAQVYARGGNIIVPLKDHPYGLRECTVEDPDGNHIYVGQPVE
ncbi:MAG: VOC family protein [Planctomycetes bacterium]|nr:VOC family protein [Planctomycetota bacterium]